MYIKMSRIDYIRKKTEIPVCEIEHSHGQFCGVCWWGDITLPPEQIPECSWCKEDSIMIKSIAKMNPGSKIEFEPKCFKRCIWWDWFDRERRNKIGCSCDTSICSCGKLKYVKREHKEVIHIVETVKNKKKK
jgi:hypothetical protein